MEVILEHIWNINKLNNGQPTQNNLFLDQFDVREGYKFRLILGHTFLNLHGLTWNHEFSFRLTKYRWTSKYPICSMVKQELKNNTGTAVGTYNWKCDQRWSLAVAKWQFILEFWIRNSFDLENWFNLSDNKISNICINETVNHAQYGPRRISKNNDCLNGFVKMLLYHYGTSIKGTYTTKHH